MNRRQRLRAHVIDRLHNSRLGRYGWFMDTAEFAGCLLVGHYGFDDAPDVCRHCGDDFAVKPR